MSRLSQETAPDIAQEIPPRENLGVHHHGAHQNGHQNGRHPPELELGRLAFSEPEPPAPGAPPSSRVPERLHIELEDALEYYAARPERIPLRLRELDREWSRERIADANVSLLTVAGCCLAGMNRRWLALPAVCGAFILSRAIRGSAPSLSLLRRLGFRSQEEIDEERRALLALEHVASVEAAQVEAAQVEVNRVDAAQGNANRPALILGAGGRPLEAARTGPRPAAARKPKKPWYKKLRYWIPIGIVVLLVAARLVLTPVALHFANKSLQGMKGFTGSIGKLSLSLWTFSFTFEDLVVDKIPSPDPQRPFIQVKSLTAEFDGRQLIRGRVVTKASVVEPRFHLVLESAPGVMGKDGVPEKPPTPPEPPDLGLIMKQIVPFRIDRVQILDGEAVIVDAGQKGRPAIRMGEMHATIENIETGTQIGNGRPTVFAARGKLQSSGKFTLFYTANLLAHAVDFAGQAKLEGLNLAELNDFLEAKLGVRVAEGEFNVFTAFRASEGKVRGGIKPLLKRLKLESASDDFIVKLRIALLDAALSIFSDRVPGREATAAIIPFEGDVTSPQPQIFPTVLSVVRNAFVEGLAESFANLPPQKEKGGGLLSWAVGAVVGRDDSPEPTPGDGSQRVP